VLPDFLVAIGLERGPLSLVGINVELLEEIRPRSRKLRLTYVGAPPR
jgi:hypothetical protein